MFFNSIKSFHLGEFLKFSGIDCYSDLPMDMEIFGTADIDSANANQLSFFSNNKFLDSAISSCAGVILTDEKLSIKLESNTSSIIIVVADPRKTYALIKQAFYPKEKSTGIISSKSSIASDAIIEEGVEVRDFACISSGAVIKSGAIISQFSLIGKCVTIGNNTIIGANCSVEFCTIGDNTVLHNNVSIGGRGFGFAPDKDGHKDIPHTGEVKIGDDVEIGSGSCIDRGVEKNTIISNGCRIDNLVHIGHNAKLGKGCIVAALTAFGGSVVLGDNVMCGAQVGIVEGVNIGNNAKLMGKTGATKDVGAGETIAGFPGRPYKEWLGKEVLINKIKKEYKGK